MHGEYNGENQLHWPLDNSSLPFGHTGGTGFTCVDTWFAQTSAQQMRSSAFVAPWSTPILHTFAPSYISAQECQYHASMWLMR